MVADTQYLFLHKYLPGSPGSSGTKQKQFCHFPVFFSLYILCFHMQIKSVYSGYFFYLSNFPLQNNLLLKYKIKQKKEINLIYIGNKAEILNKIG